LIFVVIDGLDASGKSTQASNLADFVRSHGKTVFLRFHPSTDNAFGMKAKQFLLSKGKGAHFAAAFFYMIDVIRSIVLYSWRRYDYMVFVRYLMGTAYLPVPLNRIAYHFFATIVPTSNQMFFLDVSPTEADRRLRETRERLEMFENIEELEDTRRKAISLATVGKWRIINANEPMNLVQGVIRRSLQPTFSFPSIPHRRVRPLSC
jgi:dTMP kinase